MGTCPWDIRMPPHRVTADVPPDHPTSAPPLAVCECVGQGAYTGGNEYFTFHYENLARLYATGDACENYQDWQGRRCMAARTKRGFHVGARPGGGGTDGDGDVTYASPAEAELGTRAELTAKDVADYITSTLVKHKCVSSGTSGTINMGRYSMLASGTECDGVGETQLATGGTYFNAGGYWAEQADDCHENCRATAGCTTFLHSPPSRTDSDCRGDGHNRAGHCYWEHTTNFCFDGSSGTRTGHCAYDLWSLCREDAVAATLVTWLEAKLNEAGATTVDAEATRALRSRFCPGGTCGTGSGRRGTHDVWQGGYTATVAEGRRRAYVYGEGDHATDGVWPTVVAQYTRLTTVVDDGDGATAAPTEAPTPAADYYRYACLPVTSVDARAPNGATLAFASSAYMGEWMLIHERYDGTDDTDASDPSAPPVLDLVEWRRNKEDATCTSMYREDAFWLRTGAGPNCACPATVEVPVDPVETQRTTHAEGRAALWRDTVAHWAHVPEPTRRFGKTRVCNYHRGSTATSFLDCADGETCGGHCVMTTHEGTVLDVPSDRRWLASGGVRALMDFPHHVLATMPSNGYVYGYSGRHKATWSEAQGFCEHMGGTHVTLHGDTYADYDLVNALLAASGATPSELWLGAARRTGPRPCRVPTDVEWRTFLIQDAERSLDAIAHLIGASTAFDGPFIGACRTASGTYSYYRRGFPGRNEFPSDPVRQCKLVAACEAYQVDAVYDGANRGPAFLVQHNNKAFDTETNEWVTYTGANRWKPWGKTWIEPGRLFLTTDLEGAIQFLQHQMNGAGGGAGGAGAASTICAECGGNKKHKRVADGTWCSKSKRGRSAEKLKAEGDSAF